MDPYVLTLAAVGTLSGGINAAYFLQHRPRSRIRRRAALLVGLISLGDVLQGAMAGLCAAPPVATAAAQGTATVASLCLTGLVLRRLSGPTRSRGGVR